MPHLKGSAKRLRQSHKRAAENKKIKEQIKTLIRGAKSKKDLPTLFKAIDKATKRGIFHQNRAARMRAALSRKLAK